MFKKIKRENEIALSLSEYRKNRLLEIPLLSQNQKKVIILQKRIC